MINLRGRDERGHTRIDWLDSRHSFSFGGYRDVDHMGFGALRVINDDRVIPGGGFGTHSHANMEIISYVLEGALAHEDSLGNGSVIVPGDDQRMSAGTGITHSEFNDSDRGSVHFLQIWIIPEAEDLAPGYEQKRFAPQEYQGRLCLIGDRTGSGGAVTIHQDVAMYLARLAADDDVIHHLDDRRRAWVHVARGTASVNGMRLDAGDGAAISEEAGVRLTTDSRAEVLLLDLA